MDHHGGLDNGYEIVEDNDEPFIGEVDTYSEDNNGSYNSEFIEEVEPPPAKVQRFTAFVGNALPTVTLPVPKRRGRPPKSESEKKQRTPQSKGLRISLTPRAKGPRGRPPSIPRLPGTQVGEPGSTQSPFPVVQLNNVVKKTPGRPRIHPPKDPSVKKPRGRPRKVPLEGEKAWRTECAKLRRLLKKKDELIDRMKQKLDELGLTVDEPADQPDSEDNGDDDGDTDGRDISSGTGMDGSGLEDVNTPLDIGVTEETVVPSSMEDSHQTYVNMFAAVDSYHSDCVVSNDDDSEDVDSEDDDD